MEFKSRTDLIAELRALIERQKQDLAELMQDNTKLRSKLRELDKPEGSEDGGA